MRVTSIKQIVFCLMCALPLLATNVKAEIAVIVHPSITATNIDAETIGNIFLGKTKNTPDGTRLIPVDQAEGSAISTEFYNKLLKKTPAQLNAYWSRLVFTGKGSPPQKVSSNTDVIDLVAKDPSVIGYVNASAVTNKVRVLFSIP